MKPERADSHYMRLALALARRGYGATSPNPMVGAVLVKGGRIIGRGWHRRAGQAHAEIEALDSAVRRGHNCQGATLYVTLEPCSTHGRTPPCSEAIVAAAIRSVVVGATDPNPRHRGKGFELLKRAGLKVTYGVLGPECERLNEAFNHWIVHHTPFVIVKAAMTLDGKIATALGQSKWITGEKARAYAMQLRQGADAILVGINTILADDPSLTIRGLSYPEFLARPAMVRTRRRLVLDAYARTPLTAKIVSDQNASLTTIIVSELAPKARVKALAQRVGILVAPTLQPGGQAAGELQLHRTRTGTIKAKSMLRIDLRWVLKTLGAQKVTCLLVEGGGEVNASFLLGGRAQRIAFFYAPKILGGHNSRVAVGGDGPACLRDALEITEPEWLELGPDWLLTARVQQGRRRRPFTQSATPSGCFASE